MTSYHFFLMAAVVVALAAAYVDARTGHIPNALTLGPLAVAPLAHALVTAVHTHAAALALRSLGFSVLGALLCALLPLAMYRSAGMGGGDVKLFAAVGRRSFGWKLRARWMLPTSSCWASRMGDFAVFVSPPSANRFKCLVSVLASRLFRRRGRPAARVSG